MSEPVASLSATLQWTQESLQEQSQQFEDSLLRELPENQKALATEVAAVRAELTNYDKLLQSMRRRLTQWNNADAEIFGRQLDLLVESVALTSLAYREALWSLRGPTTHSGLNEIWSLLGQRPDSALELQSLVERERAKVLHLQQHLREGQSKAALDNPFDLRPALLDFYSTYLEFLGSLLQIEDLLAVRGQMLVLGTYYSQLDLATVVRRFGGQPSKVAPINLVLNTSWLALEGSVDARLFWGLVQEAVTEVERRRTIHPQLSALAEMLQEYQAWSQEAAYEKLAQLHLRVCQEVERVAHCFEGEVPPASEPPRMVCTICGLTGPADARKCRSCGGSLKTQSASMDGLEALLGLDLSASPRLEQLLLLAIQVARGKARPDALLPLCDGLELELGEALQFCPDGKGYEKGPAAAEVELAGEDYIDALTGMTEIVGLLRELATDPSPQTAVQIGQALEQASHLFHAVQQRTAAVL